MLLHGHRAGIIPRINNRRYGPVCDRIYRFVEEHAQRGDPASVIHALDRFASEQQWLFFIGDKKGPIVREIIQEAKPMVCLELGSYVVYSAIDAARVLPQGARYYCVERDETRIETMRKIVDFAGLQDMIQIIQGSSNEVIPTLKDQLEIEAFDYVFIDHVAQRYKPDLVLLKDGALLRHGTVIVADNILVAGPTDYLEYVRQSPNYRSEYIGSKIGYIGFNDGLEKSVYVG